MSLEQTLGVNIPVEDDVYSNWKMVHHPRMIDAMKRNDPYVPPCFQIDAFLPCNHDCSWCSYRNTEFSKGMNMFDEKLFIKKDDMLRFIRECKELGVRAFEWTGGGESMMHPNITEFLQKQKRI